MSISIYVLKLQNGKYYVGKSKCVMDRLIEHKSMIGAYWTKKHPVIDIIAVYPDSDNFDEDKYTKLYMLKYGIDNVRGGSYSQVLLSDDQFDFIERELNHSEDRCMKCGKLGHFAKNCTYMTVSVPPDVVVTAVPENDNDDEPEPDLEVLSTEALNSDIRKWFH